MPAVGAGMSDEDIATVVNYVRQAWGNAAPAPAGGGKVATLRAATLTALNAAGECPPVSQPQIAAAVADPKTGLADLLKGTNLTNVLQNVDQMIVKVKAAAPHADQADIINNLTYAYCPVIKQDPTAAGPQKAVQLGNFSDRVYSALKTNGHE
jgi:ribosomal protein L12E/L44/L45/RPP1/RPP2